jgi:hypothetical protein
LGEISSDKYLYELRRNNGMELQNRRRAVIQAAFRKKLEQGRLCRNNPRISGG